MLKPYKETKGEALHYTGGNYANAYLPLEHSEEDLEEALQELVLQAAKFDATLDKEEAWLNETLPSPYDRPTRVQYFDRLRRR